MGDDDTDGNVYQLRQPEDLLATYRNRRPDMDDDNIYHLPGYQKSTGYEHLSNEDFFIAAFGQEAFDRCKSFSPDQLEQTWLKPVEPERRDDVVREFEQRGARPVWCRRP